MAGLMGLQSRSLHQRLIIPFESGIMVKNNAIEMPKSHAMSEKNSEMWLMTTGFIIVVTPRTPAMLNRFEPMMLPMERSASFLNAATSEAISSGMLVPTATIDIAITRSLTPHCNAFLNYFRIAVFPLPHVTL